MLEIIENALFHFFMSGNLVVQVHSVQLRADFIGHYSTLLLLLSQNSNYAD